MSNKKILVAYFSASGQTARLAKTLAETTHADLFAIEPETPYTPADLDWNDNTSRSTVEMRDPSSRPAIAKRIKNMDSYETVFVGFPIWWGVAPHIINAFLESYDFSGKTVIPFATSGGSGMGSTDSVLKGSCPSAAAWRTGKLLRSSASGHSLESWVKGLGL